jgi:hypothetical protein
VTTDGTDWRRLIPPPRRRPGPLAVLVRWRVEILLLLAVAAVWYVAGGVTVGILVAVLASLVLTIPPLRPVGLLVWQLLAVPHRVRAAFVQAGVATRSGYLPWVFWARPDGEAVRVAVGLRSGIAVRDLREAVPVFLAACGAAQVEIVHRPERPDRVAVVVVRPRRGLF